MDDEGEPIHYYPSRVPKLKVEHSVNDLPLLGLPLFTAHGRSK